MFNYMAKAIYADDSSLVRRRSPFSRPFVKRSSPNRSTKSPVGRASVEGNMRRSTIGALLLAAGTVLFLDGAGCASGSPGAGEPGGGNGQAGSSGGTGGKTGGAAGQGATSAGGSLITPVDSGIGTVTGTPDDAGLFGDSACAGDIRESERLPLDMYFLLDTSGSMNEQVQGGSKWQVVSGALVTFLQDAANSDIGVGIGYFPLSPPNNCMPGQAGCTCITIPIVNLNLCVPNAGGSCNAPDYAMPSVPLATPPNHAAVVADIAKHGPGGGTPTRPALEGAVQYATSWAQSTGRKTVIVLATDGDPTGCTQNAPQDVANVAAAALAGAQRLQTFVVGVGRSLTSLNLIAQSGGTGQAILVDTGGDLGQAVTMALQQIRGTALPCEFTIPARPTSQGVVDPHQVNVRYTAIGATSGAIVPMTFNGDPANCGAAGGWYYNDPASPTTIKLCDTTCQSLMGGRIEVEFGCKTVTMVR
jgi:hypothetical protein